MKRFYKPDFNNSILNISASLANFLGAPNNNATINILDDELKKDYKNIVFICFDGMGINPLNINLKKEDFLRKHIVKTLVSTFPSTTTNATTTLATNTLPLQHGWFGWSLHFPEIQQNVNIYLHTNSQTNEKVNYTYPLLKNSNYYFEKSNSEYKINTIFMPYYTVNHPENNITINNESELFEALKIALKRPGKQFVYSYVDNPDSVMHKYGVSSNEAKEKINFINERIENLAKESKDTLFIITADHGQDDVKGYVDFYKDTELLNLLTCPPFLDARTPAFIVKPNKKTEFKQKFKAKYGKDFILKPSKELIKKGYFGNTGDKGYLLGDFIAIGTYTNKMFIAYENMTKFKGHHTSLTKEMLVPLILIGDK